MLLISWIKLLTLNHALANMSDEKLTDMIEDYQRKEFGEMADKAIAVVADKLMRIALELNKRRKL